MLVPITLPVVKIISADAVLPAEVVEDPGVNSLLLKLDALEGAFAACTLSMK